MINNTREGIKRRMLKRIARMWDIEQPEHLDPIVVLLTEAMSEEIFILSGEVSDIDDRLLSKLSAALTPVHYLTARPSHAIMRAYPTEPTFCIDNDALFAYRESKTLRKYNVSRIDFTPVTPYRLIKGRIKYLNICGQMYEYSDDFRRSSMGYPIRFDTEPLNNVIWIGVDCQNDVDTLDYLSLYFDFLNINEKYSFLKLLSKAKWSVNSEDITVEYGIKTDDKPQRNMPYYENTVDFIISDIRALYDVHYVTLRSQSDGKLTFPKELEGLYERGYEDQFTTPLFWIKIEFPSSFTKEILDDIRVGMNMFPIANISKKSLSQSMTNFPLFMSLETDKNEAFMDISSVSDSSGKVYKPVYTENNRGLDTEFGYYALRRAGVERYSSTNDSFSAMARLIDILRDRTLFSHSRAEDDFNRLVAEANQAINSIAGALYETVETHQVKSYILVDKSNQGESLFVNYFVTNGAVINQFKPLTALESNLGSAIDDSQTAFVTAMRSGENDPTTERIRDKHRYMLTSKDRVITRQDIANYCRAEYGNYIDILDIKPGYRVSKEPKCGIQKTIDIHIKMKSGSIVADEVESFKSDLLCKLESRSPDSFNYQLFVN
ncbi:MAG: hypothetical protein ACRC77_11895 [Bacteroidales bacterium]